jgi:hypothetical protein
MTRPTMIVVGLIPKPGGPADATAALPVFLAIIGQPGPNPVLF